MANSHSISYLEQTLFDIPFFATTQSDAVQCILRSIAEGDFLTIATPNPEQIVQAEENPEFKKTLLKFDLFLPDGQGVVVASKMLRKPLTERIAGVDVVAELLKTIREKKLTALIVGGKGYESRKVAESEDNFWHIQIQQTSLRWYRDFDRKVSDDTTDVLNWIVKNKPTFVFVALGAPYQEQWIIEQRDELKKAGVKCAMVVGGAFDVLSGNIARAPDSMQQFGLEWAWRLLQQPWRWKRQLRLVKYMRLVAKQIGKQ
jgi:N-acetylglucosaminyldiphosphoundecaprenol N-acetyl-beta-D-mannosaminyltransferase